MNPDDAHLTDRQKEAIVAQKEKEEKDRQKKEDRKKSEAMAKEKELLTKIAELQVKTGPVCLGRDRAYRRFWILESLPGLFIEHDDDTVGVCLPNPTVINPNSKPIDEATALERVKEILDKKSPEGQGSDKENDQDEHKKDLKTYSKKPPQQKV